MKVELGAKNCLYPLPTTLVGALVGRKPNYLTIAHVGIMDLDSISLGLHKGHYTNAGIRENCTFSVNIPSVEIIRETDHCGLISGKTQSKAEIFKTFYGSLKSAPMIEECPINMECKLIRTVDFPNHDVFVGKIVATYCDESVLVDGVVDFERVKPILFVMNDRSYWRLGGRLANAWSVGREFTKKQTTLE